MARKNIMDIEILAEKYRKEKQNLYSIKSLFDYQDLLHSHAQSAEYLINDMRELGINLQISSTIIETAIRIFQNYANQKHRLHDYEGILIASLFAAARLNSIPISFSDDFGNFKNFSKSYRNLCRILNLKIPQPPLIKWAHRYMSELSLTEQEEVIYLESIELFVNHPLLKYQGKSARGLIASFFYGLGCYHPEVRKQPQVVVAKALNVTEVTIRIRLKEINPIIIQIVAQLKPNMKLYLIEEF